MKRMLLAIRVFFRTIFSAAAAQQVERLLAGGQLLDASQAAGKMLVKPQKPAKVPSPLRSEALTLLATLQREARFVDFLKEPLDEYSDEQVGAAARDVHRECAKVVDRLFAIRPLVAEEEGAAVSVPEGFDAGRYQLSGNVTGNPPFEGRLVHHGWEAAACKIPAWNGSKGAAKVIAPTEVEL